MKQITAQQMIARLVELLDEQQVDDMPLIYAQDDEGNYFDKLYFSPSLCEFNDRETVVFESDLAEDTKFKPNAICIN